MTKAAQSAFTLIELSITLIIIGLIVSGILVGRDLIFAAEVRQQVSQIEKFNTATHTFKLKYDCLPGDCPTAENLGLGVSGNPGANGDGNGVFDISAAGTMFDSPETVNFWYHLYKANLIGDVVPGYQHFDSRPGTFTPPLKMRSSATTTFFANPKGGVTILPLNVDDAAFGGVQLETLFDMDSKIRTVWWLSTVYGYGVGAPGVFAPRDAYALDSKMDDGLPRSGTMRSITYDISGWDSVGDAQVPNCIDFAVTPNRYNYTLTDLTGMASLCSPMILTQF